VECHPWWFVSLRANSAGKYLRLLRDRGTRETNWP
jgi:hypothetical protein